MTSVFPPGKSTATSEPKRALVRWGDSRTVTLSPAFIEVAVKPIRRSRLGLALSISHSVVARPGPLTAT